MDRFKSQITKLEYIAYEQATEVENLSKDNRKLRKENRDFRELFERVVEELDRRAAIIDRLKARENSSKKRLVK